MTLLSSERVAYNFRSYKGACFDFVVGISHVKVELFALHKYRAYKVMSNQFLLTVRDGFNFGDLSHFKVGFFAIQKM